MISRLRLRRGDGMGGNRMESRPRGIRAGEKVMQRDGGDDGLRTPDHTGGAGAWC